MYFGNTPTRLFTGGHASSGAPDPSTTWLFAEGATGPYFDTYILLANPGTTPATVRCGTCSTTAPPSRRSGRSPRTPG